MRVSLILLSGLMILSGLQISPVENGHSATPMAGVASQGTPPAQGLGELGSGGIPPRATLSGLLGNRGSCLMQEVSNIAPRQLTLTIETRDVVYAQAALGGSYEMVMLLTNRSGSERNLTFYLRQANDQDWPDQWQYCVDGTCNDYAYWVGFQARGLSPNATYKFRVKSSGSTRAGYMVIRPDSGILLTDFMINYFYIYKNEGEIVDSTGVTPSKVGNRFVFPAEYSNGGLVRTAFAWSPALFTPSSSFTANIILYDDTGTRLATQPVTFAGHMAIFIDQVFTSIPSYYLGYVEIQSPHPLALTVLRMDSGALGPQFTVVEPTAF